MTGKKKAQDSVSLQIEVETDVQWRALLMRDGLIVVDVYASWAGPCTSMISILKRVKIEINDERLWLAIACSDNISELVAFKDQSEPTWLFIGGGRPVKLFRGSDAPKLISLIKQEFESELMCMEGKAARTMISINDEMSRRRKAEAEAQRLAQMVRDQAGHERKESATKDWNDGLAEALQPYTVLVIQNFLLETGAVTEIRDYLTGEFKIEQERYVNLNDDGIRQLFHIPYQVPDPTATVPEVNVQKHKEGEEPSTEEVTEEGEPHSDFLEVVTEEAPRSRRGSNASTILSNGKSERSPSPAPPQPTPAVKMMDVTLPDGLVGDTLVMLLESVEIRRLVDAGEKPAVTADEYIQRKVGPLDLKDAVENVPQSLHAVYGKGEYMAGVWCPRSYSDKRYVMINFFPRFVTEMLMPPPGEAPKYVVAVFSADKAALITKQLELHRKDVLVDGIVTLPSDLVQDILRSQDFGERYLSTKDALDGKRVYAVTVDEQNTDLMYLIDSNGPIYKSLDGTVGKIESDRIFSRKFLGPGLNAVAAVVDKAMVAAKKQGDTMIKQQQENRKSSTASLALNKDVHVESTKAADDAEPKTTVDTSASQLGDAAREDVSKTPQQSTEPVGDKAIT